MDEIPFSKDSYFSPDKDDKHGKPLEGRKIAIEDLLGRGSYGWVYGNKEYGITLKTIKNTDHENVNNNALVTLLKKQTIKKHTQLLTIEEIEKLKLMKKNRQITHVQLLYGEIISFSRLCYGVNIRTLITDPIYQEHAKIDIFKYVLIAGTTVLSEMNEHDWYHFDIKPENIMLCKDLEDDGYNASVVDFGLAKQVDNTKLDDFKELGSMGWNIIFGQNELKHFHKENYKVPIERLNDVLETMNNEKPNNPDKFALGLTLLDIMGSEEMLDSEINLIKALLYNETWDLILKNTQDYLNSEGGKNKKFKTYLKEKSVMCKDRKRRNVYTIKGHGNTLFVKVKGLYVKKTDISCNA